MSRVRSLRATRKSTAQRSLTRRRWRCRQSSPRREAAVCAAKRPPSATDSGKPGSKRGVATTGFVVAPAPTSFAAISASICVASVRADFCMPRKVCESGAARHALLGCTVRIVVLRTGLVTSVIAPGAGRRFDRDGAGVCTVDGADADSASVAWVSREHELGHDFVAPAPTYITTRPRPLDGSASTTGRRRKAQRALRCRRSQCR